MKYIFNTLLLFILAHSITMGQMPGKTQLAQLNDWEKKLQPSANAMINDTNWVIRFRQDSIFIRNFVQALKVPNSFYYPFDSINTISKLYAPDSSFRIYTWQITKDISYYRQYGAIQMRTKDGSLKLFPLLDYSEFAINPNDSLRDNKHWIGAVYYHIVLTKFNNTKIYTLIGYDGNNARTNRKWLEILHFDKGVPVFGGKFFDYNDSDRTKPTQPVYRFSIECKKDVIVKLNWDENYKAIVFDQLISETNNINDKYTLVPNGELEEFEWKNNKWTWKPFEQ